MLAIVLTCVLYFSVPIFLGIIFSNKHQHLSFVIPFVASFIIQHIFLIIFSLFLDDYLLSNFIAGGIVAFLGFYYSRNYEPKKNELKIKFFRVENYIPVFLFILIFSGYLAIRGHYAFISFYNNAQDVGVEKLFNLSLHQSFLYGKNWTPEWVWLSGEPIKYYVFLKSIPGIISSHVRVLFGDPASGGVLFILSEAFYAALTPSLMSAFLFLFLKNSSRTVLIVFSIAAPLIGFFGVHFQGIAQGLSALITGDEVDWLKLPEQIIPFTHSQYQLWLMLLGDNHAYSQVYFLQILFLGSFLFLVLQRIENTSLAILVGVIGAAVALSHSGSVMVDISILTPFIFLLSLYLLKENFLHFKAFVYHLGVLCMTACAILLWTWQQVGNVRISLLDNKITTSFIPFLSHNFSILFFAFLLIAIALCPISRKSLKELVNENIQYEWMVFFLGSIFFAGIIFGYFSIATIAIFSLVSFLSFAPKADDSPDKEKDSSPLIFSLFLSCVILMLIPPEIMAFDHTVDNRIAWIRFQMGLRFWPESYILIPFALALAAAEPIQRNLSLRKSKILVLSVSMFIFILLYAHVPVIKNRILRSTQAYSLDGFSEFYARYPNDTKIIEYLRSLENEKIIIGELCSIYTIPDVPNHFGWSGRIAAYSGRVGVCGWGRHALLYNSILEKDGFKGISLEARIDAFATSYRRILSNAHSNTPLLISDIDTLKTFGVTHLIFGEQEKLLFPNATVATMSQRSGGKVVLENKDGTGVIKMPW